MRSEAVECISLSRKRFPNISIDLIYGIPGLSDDRWRENLSKASRVEDVHISLAMPLLWKMIRHSNPLLIKVLLMRLMMNKPQRQFNILLDTMQLHSL